MAESDLVGIWRYTHETWGIEQADHYVDMLELVIKLLQQEPENGTERSDVRAGYWSKRAGRHVIFYTFTASELRIRRVLHDRMGLGKNV